MSNEEFENEKEEYFRHKAELEEKNVLNNFHKKNADRESVWERSDEIKYGFENEYCTDNLKKERSDQHRNENAKRACKQIKNKKFKNTIISPELKRRIKKIAIGTSIIGIGIGAIAGFEKTYELGVNNGKSELLQEVSKTQLVKYSLNSAPSKLIDSWADAKMTQLDRLTQNNDSLRDVFNSILENEYGNVKSAYYEYIETGSENDREKLVQSAETLQNKFKNSIHNGDYSFKGSKFAYALLRDPDGNFIDYETLDPNLEVYEAVGLNVDGSFEPGDVLYEGAFYRKYNDSSSIQNFKMR
mgnify:FL=1